VAQLQHFKGEQVLIDQVPELAKLLARPISGAVLLRDPDVAGFASQAGSTGGNGNAQSANTARFFIALKPREERTLTASQIINRLRPQFAGIEGANMFLQATQDITVGGRAARGSFQYTLQDVPLPGRAGMRA
jgi:multidrug efflux pump subunit AcrB